MSRYFSPDEPGLDKGRYSHLNDLLLNKLDKLRELYGKPINITSSYRAASHPIEAAKQEPGTHSFGEACDCAVIGGGDTFHFVACAIEVGFQRIGISRKKNFVHIDIGNYTRGLPKSIWTY